MVLVRCYLLSTDLCWGLWHQVTIPRITLSLRAHMQDMTGRKTMGTGTGLTMKTFLRKPYLRHTGSTSENNHWLFSLPSWATTGTVVVGHARLPASHAGNRRITLFESVGLFSLTLTIWELNLFWFIHTPLESVKIFISLSETSQLSYIACLVVPDVQNSMLFSE